MRSGGRDVGFWWRSPRCGRSRPCSICDRGRWSIFRCLRICRSGKIFPDIGEASFVDVALDDAGLGSVDVEASEYVACYCDAGNGDSCHAKEVPVADFSFVFKTEVVTATVGDGFVVSSFAADEFHNGALVFICEKKFGVLKCTAYRLDAHNTPAVDIYAGHYFIERFEFTDGIMVNNSSNHDMFKALKVNEVLDSFHSFFVCAFKASYFVMSFGEAVDTYGYGIHSASLEHLGNFRCYKYRVGSHSPLKTKLVSVARYFFEAAI